MTKETGRKGSLVLKLDLEKAYDCINYNFLTEVLKKVGFSQNIFD